MPNGSDECNSRRSVFAYLDSTVGEARDYCTVTSADEKKEMETIPLGRAIFPVTGLSFYGS